MAVAQLGVWHVNERDGTIVSELAALSSATTEDKLSILADIKSDPTGRCFR